ncbi:MAG: twin-arginine translocation signal domain-containing protein [Mycobacterium sp.]
MGASPQDGPGELVSRRRLLRLAGIAGAAVAGTACTTRPAYA